MSWNSFTTFPPIRTEVLGVTLTFNEVALDLEVYPLFEPPRSPNWRYSWCRVSALINLTATDYYERGHTRWLRFQEK
jgi:hypothetical protein